MNPLRNVFLSSLLLSCLALACSDEGSDATGESVTPQAGSAGASAGQGGSGESGTSGQGGSSAGTSAAGAGQGGSDAGGAGQGGSGAGEAGQGGDAGVAGASAGSSGEGGSGGAAGDGGSAGSGGSGTGGSAGGGGSCERVEGPADGVRKVVISHPYLGPGQKAKGYEVLTLSANGTLAKAGQSFEMNTATTGEIVFTRDGKLGFVAQEDGTIGVFSLAGEQVQVLNAAYDPGTYVSHVMMAPSQDRLYVLNDQWRENGGGVYSVKIGCDDSLTNEGLVAPAKLPGAMAFFPGQSQDVLLAATDALDSKAGDSAHVLALDTKTLKAGTDAFGADDAVVSSALITGDGAFGLIAENSEFSGKPNRIAVLGIGTPGLTPIHVISSINDPVSIKASPFDNRILVASGYGNALLSLKPTPSSSSAQFADDGPLTYKGKKPQLPGDMVVIQRGSLKGRVLVVEVDGVRQAQFAQDGSAPTDLGLFDLQGSTESIPGAIGVQP